MRLVLPFGILVSVILLISGANAQDDVEKMKKFFSDAARSVNFVLDDETALQFREQPISSWTNPERRTAAGAMFFWTKDQRPQIALCIYPVEEGGFDLEFQSLAESRLTATKEGSAFWSPVDAGIEFQWIDDAPEPGPNVRNRGLQMRKLSRSLTAKLIPPNRQEIPLRLQAKPIYQYVGSDEQSDLIQGAVFCFVQGTDPEVLVIIEAVDDEQKGQAYRYAIARMSMVPTQVFRASKLLWETNWPQIRPDKSYYVVRHSD